MYENIINTRSLQIPDGLNPVEAYKMLQQRYDSEVIFERARDAFFKEHPDCPKPRPLPLVDLVFSTEYEPHLGYPSENIVEGFTRAFLYPYIEEYIDLFCDKDVIAYEKEHWNDELMRLQMLDFNTPVRPIRKMHLHSPHNTYWIDCTCEENGIVEINDDDMYYLQKYFGYHGHAEELKLLNEQNVIERPKYFYVAADRILKHNLGRGIRSLRY